MGPTAAGKSAVALALATRFGGEIVSVDSAQVYRDMNIGTAKPDALTRAAVPHHLLDVIAPTDSYSAARFRRDAPHARHVPAQLIDAELTGMTAKPLERSDAAKPLGRHWHDGEAVRAKRRGEAARETLT